jgi:hypothetical protein
MITTDMHTYVIRAQIQYTRVCDRRTDGRRELRRVVSSGVASQLPRCVWLGLPAINAQDCCQTAGLRVPAYSVSVSVGLLLSSAKTGFLTHRTGRHAVNESVGCLKLYQQYPSLSSSSSSPTRISVILKRLAGDATAFDRSLRRHLYCCSQTGLTTAS